MVVERDSLWSIFAFYIRWTQIHHDTIVNFTNVSLVTL